MEPEISSNESLRNQVYHTPDQLRAKSKFQSIGVHNSEASGGSVDRRHKDFNSKPANLYGGHI